MNKMSKEEFVRRMTSDLKTRKRYKTRMQNMDYMGHVCENHYRILRRTKRA